MLTTQLRELGSDGAVRRKIFAEVPPRLEYAITPAALALKPVIDAVSTWWRNHGRAAPGSKDPGPRQPQGPERVMISTRAKIRILAAQPRMTMLKH
jgi:DNA-binding HxlR family transcriptional regulator